MYSAYWCLFQIHVRFVLVPYTEEEICILGENELPNSTEGQITPVHIMAMVVFLIEFVIEEKLE